MKSYLILLLTLLNISFQKDAAALLAELRQSVSKGKPGSYSELWDTYVKAFLKSDGYIKDYYSSYSRFTDKDRDKGSGGAKEGEKYNREHSIPKSWWGGSTATGSQGADPFIVIPADKFVNNRRSSYPGTVFEPNDDVKGDLARIVFYSIVKYESSYKWTSGGGSVIYSGDKNKNFGLTDYAVKLFTEWNKMDPPDQWEISVNNALDKLQGNKNPFIEHPEYVDMIWGNSAKSNNANLKEDKGSKKFLSFTKK